MGVYSNARFDTGFTTESVEGDLSYYGEAGAQRILAEAAQNDLAMFEAVISNDIAQAYTEHAVLEGTVLEDALVSLQEAAGTGLFARLKEFIKKIWAKIKGLIMSFITKLRGSVTSDNKKLVEKFKAVINKNATKLAKMKFKWSEEEKAGIELDYGQFTVAASVMEDKLFGATDDTKASDTRALVASAQTIKDLKAELEDENWNDKQYAKIVKGSEESTFAKDFHEACFAEEEEIEGLTTARTSEIIGTLLNAADGIKEIKKIQDDSDKFYAKALSRCDAAEKKYLTIVATKDKAIKVRNGNDTETITSEKTYPTSTGTNSGETYAQVAAQAAASLYSLYSKSQTVTTKVISCMMSEVQFAIKQARRVWIQAAAYAQKAVKEEADLFEAVGESADFDTDMLFAVAD